MITFRMHDWDGMRTNYRMKCSPWMEFSLLIDNEQTSIFNGDIYKVKFEIMVMVALLRREWIDYTKTKMVIFVNK